MGDNVDVTQIEQDNDTGNITEIIEQNNGNITKIIEQGEADGVNVTEIDPGNTGAVSGLKFTYGNVTQTVGACLQPGALPLIIQNSSSWAETGCNRGFYCPNNNATALPEYCTPVPPCLQARLGGATCGTPMGSLEPVVCPRGYYCPNGTEKVICPAKHFCPLGSYEPIGCKWPATSCGTNSVVDSWALPLQLLIAADAIVLLWVGIYKFIKRRRARKGKTHGVRHAAKNWVLQRQHTYSKVWSPSPSGNVSHERASSNVSNTSHADHTRSLSEDSDSHTLDADANDLERGASIANLQRTGLEMTRTRTGFDLLVSGDYSMEDAQNKEKTQNNASVDLQQFIQSMHRCLGANKFGLSFEFENLSFQPKGSPKKILDQVSGCIEAGKLWAIMGASGAGKSTFVNVLMGKQKHTGGITRVNGLPGSISKYRKIIGYVPQDDIVLPELTVRENILHSARVRLPKSWKDGEIQAHVDILISCLQLSHVKNSLVGSTAHPVISGGQRKRVSIGIELAAAPMAIFLDEPTSGLDATSAASIMMTLKALTKMGMTIVTIIHQPRQEIWESLDNILLLGAGRMLYSGKGSDVVDYFQRECGFDLPKHGNPADAVMDIITGEGRHYKRVGDTSIQGMIDNWSRKGNLSRQSSRISVLDSKDMQTLRMTIKDRGAPVHRQILFCTQRALVQQWRDKESFFFEVGVGALAGGLIGMAYISAKGNNFVGMYVAPYEILSSGSIYLQIPQMSLLVGVAIGLTGSSPGVRVFGEERLVFWREAASGHNRFAYYLGKVLSTFPRMILANLHFTALFMYLSTPRIAWEAAFVANQLYCYCIYGLASCVSMITKREDGPLIATILTLIVGVLNGMSPSLAKVESWHILWLWRSFPGTWLAEGYFDKNISPLRYLYKIDVASHKVGFKLDRYGMDMAILLGVGTMYRVIGYLLMRFLNRDRQK